MMKYIENFLRAFLDIEPMSKFAVYSFSLAIFLVPFGFYALIGIIYIFVGFCSIIRDIFDYSGVALLYILLSSPIIYFIIDYIRDLRTEDKYERQARGLHEALKD